MGRKNTDEIKPILDAIWGNIKPREITRPFEARGPGGRRQFVGSVKMREYGRGPFLLRVVREGEESEDSVFTDRADFNAAIKKDAKEFEKRKDKLERQFRADAEADLKRHPTEFTANTEFGEIKARVMFKENEVPLMWVGLERQVIGIRVDYILPATTHWGKSTPERQGEGLIEFQAVYLNDVIELARRELYQRTQRGPEDSKHFDLTPLIDREIGNLTWPTGYPLMSTKIEGHSPVRVIVDLPERARKTIETRRRMAGRP